MSLCSLRSNAQKTAVQKGQEKCHAFYICTFFNLNLSYFFHLLNGQLKSQVFLRLVLVTLVLVTLVLVTRTPHQFSTLPGSGINRNRGSNSTAVNQSPEERELVLATTKNSTVFYFVLVDPRRQEEF